MSKVQTKLNFVEKKKTSARLEETFNSKEKIKKVNAKLKTDYSCISNSPNKLLASKKINSISTSSKSCDSNEEPSGKENRNYLINDICKRNPVVVLFRSPSKFDNGIRSCSINDERPQEKVRDVVNEVQKPSCVLNLNESPMKCTERRNQENERYVLRSSPLKRAALSPEKIKYSGKFVEICLVLIEIPCAGPFCSY